MGGGEFVGVGPADEPARFLAIGGRLIGEPTIEIGLLAGAHGEVVCLKPVQEHDGAAGESADHFILLSSGGFRSKRSSRFTASALPLSNHAPS